MAGRTVCERIEGSGGPGPASSHYGRGAGGALGCCRPHGLLAVAALAGQADQTGDLLECLYPQATVCLGGRDPTPQTGGAPRRAEGGSLANRHEGASIAACSVRTSFILSTLSQLPVGCRQSFQTGCAPHPTQVLK